ncbi:MAG TPA: phosphoribosyltransferase family protein [Solirubrobacteraceae bacterium]|jgi:predicted phosphoribosyltransferase
MHYEERRDAGRRLAGELAELAGARAVVVALPRGGVPVGVEVARALQAPLDLLAVRKLGAASNPELGVGALAEDGVAVLDPASVGMAGMSESALAATLERESIELRRRVERYRGERVPVAVQARTVIVVDDGLATGLTVLAAVRALRKRGAARIVVAAPVGSREAIAMLGDDADLVICAVVPERLMGVGRWYRDFAPVSDEEVVRLLAEAGRE